jgi:hypothetical protein
MINSAFKNIVDPEQLTEEKIGEVKNRKGQVIKKEILKKK